MNSKTEPVAEKSSDEASSDNAATDTVNQETAVERKQQPASGNVLATTRGTRNTRTSASAPKRKKRFVL